jgi:hypothetical protein
MRKWIFGALFICTLSSTVFGQSYQGTIEYDKKKQDAFLIDYSYPAEAAENAIVQKFGKLGYKPKEEKGILNRDKGFKIFKNAFISEISDGSMDYFVKVERKSRKQSDECVLYLIVLKNDVNVRSMDDHNISERVRSFLDNMAPEVEAANLEIQIKDQEDVVAKAEKKLSSLKSDHDSLEKKIADNETSQTDTQKDIENQKMRLGELKGQRKN